ncbi:MAG: vWA domain-containing protein [Acidobacteriota bacterium]
MTDNKALILARKQGLKAQSSLTEFVKSKTADESALLICDVSGSMDGTKIIRLREVINRLRQARQLSLLAFGNSVSLVTELPGAGGGTPMAEALRLAATQKPRRAILLSDGEPDDASAALAAARELTMAGCKLSCVYIGPEGGEGYRFLKRLAAEAHGEMANVDLLGQEAPSQLEAKIVGLLGA